MRAPLRTIRGRRIHGAARTGLVTCLTLVVVGAFASVAAADPDGTPSQSDVEAAQRAVSDKARDVAAVQADLVLADQRLQRSAVDAGRAAEAYNGALWQLKQARREVRAAEVGERVAQRAVTRQQTAYGDALASSYVMAPQLTAMSAMIDADGPSAVMERYTTLDTAESAMDGQYDQFRAMSTLATVATGRAQQARTHAAALEQDAAAAKQQAQDAADAAAAEAQAVAAQKDGLIHELADLQHVSVTLAARRQHALEQAAAQAAAEAAQHAAEQAAQQAAAQQAAQQAAHQAAQEAAAEQAAQQDQSGQQPPSPAQPADPAPAPAPEPSPSPSPPPASGGAAAAIAFARAQIGEPYVYGAAGPGSWDCSGLTMGAWRAGGRSLPHYSVAQYEQSTPISPSQLQPGDLVFWGDSSAPSSIYHVALYVGGGMIIHAPRPGRGVELVSMYYWITPNFYARP